MRILINKALETSDGKSLLLYQKALCGLTADIIGTCFSSPADIRIHGLVVFDGILIEFAFKQKKKDRGRKKELNDLFKIVVVQPKVHWYEKSIDVDDVIPVSAKYGHGVDHHDITSEHPERFFIAEIVRENFFMQFRNEVPACQVNVIHYQTRPNAKDFIQVEIVVEKNKHRIILIEKAYGNALKLLATTSRLHIEDFLQKKSFLRGERELVKDEGLLRPIFLGAKYSQRLLKGLALSGFMIKYNQRIYGINQEWNRVTAEHPSEI
ncbi:hypothetical protein L1987_09854 [Smallanthus sonchifolius]|uniref:Uncharacterized protein n=1 Tax=Smallanthus sonchifolius TaxID=185202 RepID=A0ACB9JQG2_9ASTR|nr:hypothetical protein L1987_09854 [Smallanthus sonchifolius]